MLHCYGRWKISSICCAHHYSPGNGLKPRTVPRSAILFPLGLVVTPTKGLSANIVSFHNCRKFVFLTVWLAFKVKELENLRMSALAYCKKTMTEARKAGHKLAIDIKECKRWGIVCIDPEHLRDSEWREITEWHVFRSNVIFGCVDEAHIIKEWGLLF
jgi:hypothetical protein